MNREIKFRGIGYDGKWVYGSLVNNLWVDSENTKFPGRLVCEIIRIPECGYYDCWDDMVDSDGIIQVDAETVGQFTGRQDKNGKDIYEGDIWIDSHKCNHQVKWMNIGWVGLSALCEMEIIGNIHENPTIRPTLLC